MKKISMLLAFLGFIGLQVVFAQTRDLSGVVTSSEDGTTIPGASVVVKGTTLGTVTDMEGKFTLKVPQNAKALVVTFVGMTSADVPLTSATNYTIKMKSESVAIDEVVVTALGQTTNKAKVGYSTATFTSESISKDGSVNMLSGISNKVAGANISDTGGPGSSTKVVLRGYGIIGGGNNQPLYVIDGVPLNDDRLAGSFTSSIAGTSDFGNGMTNVNPNDIESISILKGTAASSLYGSSAKNGVVMITTKRGKSGAIKVEYNGSFNVSEVGKLPEMENQFGQGWGGAFILSENGSWGPPLDGRMRAWGSIVDNSQLIKPFSFIKNNMRKFYVPGTEANNSIAISGGTDATRFIFSYSNVSSDGVIPTASDYLERNTFSLKTNSDYGKFSINTSFNYINRKQNAPLTGQGGTTGATTFESLLQIPVDIPISDFRDYKNKFFNVNGYFTPYAENPYYALHENGITQNADRFFGNVDMKYKFTKAFNAQFRLGGDFNNERTTGWSQPNAPTAGSWDAGNNVEGFARAVDVGSVLQSSNFFGTINGDFLLNYTKDLNANFNLEATAGANFFQSAQRSELAYATNLVIPGLFNLSNTSVPPTTSDFNSLRRRMGIYGTATLGFKNQLFLTADARNDWSSTLPTSANSILYYGVNGSWVISKTLDLSSTPFTYLKLRSGYGQTGSDPNPYQIYATLQQGNVGLGFGSLTTPFNGTPAFGISNTIGNMSLKPIMTKEFEAGTEIKMFHDRIGIDFSYYNKITNGQIFTVPIAYSTGYSGMVQNIGQVSNKGIELALDLKPIVTRNFSWGITYTYSRNKNNVDRLSTTIPNVDINSAYDAVTRAVVGKPVGEMYAPVPLTSPNGKIVVNGTTGIPQASQTLGDYGSTMYKYMMGMTNTFTYKNWQLSGSLDFRYGGVMYSGTADLLLFTGNAKATAYNNRRPFIVPNSVVANTDAGGNTVYSENQTVISSSNYSNYWYPTTNPGTSYYQRIIDRSFLKLRTVALSYKLPERWAAKILANQASIGIYAKNILLWTPKSNMYLDPEGTNLGNDLGGELGEFRAAPTSESFGASLKITF